MKRLYLIGVAASIDAADFSLTLILMGQIPAQNIFPPAWFLNTLLILEVSNKGFAMISFNQQMHYNFFSREYQTKSLILIYAIHSKCWIFIILALTKKNSDLELDLLLLFLVLAQSEQILSEDSLRDLWKFDKFNCIISSIRLKEFLHLADFFFMVKHLPPLDLIIWHFSCGPKWTSTWGRRSSRPWNRSSRTSSKITN